MKQLLLSSCLSLLLLPNNSMMIWGPRFDPWVRKIPWRSKWQPTLVFLPEKSHAQRGLVCYSLKGCKSRTLKTKTQNCVLKSLISILPRKRQGTESESKSIANHTHYDNILLKKSLRKCYKKVTLL